LAIARISPVRGLMTIADPPSGAQFALGQVLQVLVDRQLKRRSGGRRLLEAAERMAPGVGLHVHRAGLPADL
jgi:hypothetical protein